MAFKQCVTCGETKDEAEFNYRNKLLGKRWGTCKTCQSTQRADWYERNKDTHVKKVRERRDRVVEESRQYVWDYLSTHPCVGDGINPCPYNERNPTVLEFDHVKGRKRMIVSQLIQHGYGIEAIKREISKCEVRCSNCHKKKTAREQGWFRG